MAWRHTSGIALGLGALALLAGCDTTGGTITFEGEDMDQFFPYDVQASWTFVSQDESLPYLLVATLTDDVEQGDASFTWIHTMEFRKSCFGADPECIDGEYLWSWRVSSDGGAGVLMYDHDYDGTEESFGSGLRWADPTMRVGESVASDADGATWSSTFEGFTECPAPYWRENKPRCVEMTLDRVDSDHPLEGTLFAAAGFNVVAFELAGESARWELRDYKVLD